MRSLARLFKIEFEMLKVIYITMHRLGKVTGADLSEKDQDIFGLTKDELSALAESGMVICAFTPSVKTAVASLGIPGLQFSGETTALVLGGS